MKTAMQELIEIYEYYHSFEEFNEWFMDMGKKAMLEKEKEQIMNAHKSGWQDCQQHIMTIGETTRNEKKYYNQTYNT